MKTWPMTSLLKSVLVAMSMLHDLGLPVLGIAPITQFGNRCWPSPQKLNLRQCRVTARGRLLLSLRRLASINLLSRTGLGAEAG